MRAAREVVKRMNATRVGKYPVRQQGLTLVELLVSIALGLFLAWGAIQAFLSGKQAYSLQQSMSRIQENARMAQELIGYDLRDSGNYGCAVGKFVANGRTANALSPAYTVPDNNPGLLLAQPQENNFAFAVFATNNVSGAPNADTVLQTPLNPPPRPGTDVLIAHISTNLGSIVLGPTTTPAGPIPTASSITVSHRGLVTGDTLSLGDCTRNFIFRPNAINGSGPTRVINHAYIDPPIAGSTVIRLDTVIYYIADNPAGQPALYRRLLGQPSEELLEGVENLQLQIGIDTNNDGRVDEFRTPNLVTADQWSAWHDRPGSDAGLLDAGGSGEQNVAAVRYSLLLRSNEELMDEPQQYTYEGVVTVPTDRRLRQVITNTIGIRSRVN